MKKSKILLSFALLCSPFWLAAAQNESSRASAASQSSAPSASNFAANNAAPKNSTQKPASSTVVKW